MSWTEWAGFLTGALSVVLVVRRDTLNFPVGMANNAFYFVLFLDSGLYADAGLQVVFFALAVQGWWLWLHGGTGRTRLEIRPLDRRTAAAMAVGGVLTTALLTSLLATWTDSTVPFWDALTAALSLGAQWLLNRKHTANWWVWVVADLIYIALYLYKDLKLTALLYAVFLALCVLGLRRWQRAEEHDLVLAA